VGEPGSGFLEVTFDGGRFSLHSAPVTVLAELATFQQLLVVVARHLFKQAHPERQRVPRGFPDAAQLHLTGTRNNCFTAVLSRPSAVLWRQTLFDWKIFDEARDLSVDALAAAEQGSPLPPGFPPAGLGLLGALGCQLMEDEGLILRGNVRTARVSQQSRERIATLAKRPLERESVLDGEVEQLDDASDRFWLRARGGERLEVPFKRHQRLLVVEALKERPIIRVRIRGLVVFGPQRKVTMIEEFELVDHERSPEIKKLWARIDELSRVPRGWLDGDGQPPTEHAVARARDVLARLLVDQSEVARPKVFPTPDGGLQAEWVMNDWAAEARFSPESESVWLEATNGVTHEERSREVLPGEVSADNASVIAAWLGALATEGKVRV
jgi:hypothetical protein